MLPSLRVLQFLPRYEAISRAFICIDGQQALEIASGRILYVRDCNDGEFLFCIDVGIFYASVIARLGSCPAACAAELQVKQSLGHLSALRATSPRDCFGQSYTYGIAMTGNLLFCIDVGIFYASVIARLGSCPAACAAELQVKQSLGHLPALR